MFKFMKSKKGFSLVELMIVVVIMAILVAVAVPIFNSVTGNAREKTCIDNQRQVMTSISNLYMAEGVSGVAGKSFTITFNGEEVTIGTSFADFENGDNKVSESEIQGAFKTVPGCGDDANVIVATVKANTQGTATVSTKCFVAASDGSASTTEVHKLAQNS